MSNIKEYREVLAGKITLDVDGEYYTTTAQTLMKSEYMRGLVEFCHGISGTCFIDRDSLLFREVLYYLRTGEFFDPENVQSLKRLKLEAQFYGLPSLETKIEDISNQLSGKNNVTPPPAETLENTRQGGLRAIYRPVVSPQQGSWRVRASR